MGALRDIEAKLSRSLDAPKRDRKRRKKAKTKRAKSRRDTRLSVAAKKRMSDHAKPHRRVKRRRARRDSETTIERTVSRTLPRKRRRRRGLARNRRTGRTVKRRQPGVCELDYILSSYPYNFDVRKARADVREIARQSGKSQKAVHRFLDGAEIRQSGSVQSGPNQWIQSFPPGGRDRSKRSKRDDSLSNRGNPDRLRINIKERWERAYWAKKLGISVTRLIALVKRVGPVATRVRQAAGTGRDVTRRVKRRVKRRASRRTARRATRRDVVCACAKPTRDRTRPRRRKAKRKTASRDFRKAPSRKGKRRGGKRKVGSRSYRDVMRSLGFRS